LLLTRPSVLQQYGILMKKFLLIFTAVAIVSAAFFYVRPTDAQEDKQSAESQLVSPNIVIAQLYGGGGNNVASQFQNDFVVLFNRGSSAVSLNGWSTQYASATGTNWLVTPLSNVTLQPGQYYLIQYAAGTTVTGLPALPTPDVIAPPVTVNGNTFIPNLSGTTGKFALVNSTTTCQYMSC
jgi:uncharacterized protein